jgi:hypothetical protein
VREGAGGRCSIEVLAVAQDDARAAGRPQFPRANDRRPTNTRCCHPIFCQFPGPELSTWLGLRGAADTVRAPRARDGRPRAGRAVVPRGAQRARVDRRGARERPVPARRARHLRRRPAPRRAVVRGASRARPAAAVVARLARRARGAAEPGRAERARAARHGRRPAPAAAVAGGARHALGPRGAARRVGGAAARGARRARSVEGRERARRARHARGASPAPRQKCPACGGPTTPGQRRRAGMRLGGGGHGPGKQTEAAKPALRRCSPSPVPRSYTNALRTATTRTISHTRSLPGRHTKARRRADHQRDLELTIGEDGEPVDRRRPQSPAPKSSV